MEPVDIQQTPQYTQHCSTCDSAYCFLSADTFIYNIS